MLLSGLLLFVCCKEISANDLTPKSILSEFFLYKPYHILPDSHGLLDFSFSYSPLLKEKRRSDNDHFNSFLNFMDFSGRLSLGNSRIYSITTYSYDSYCGALRIDNADYGFYSSQKVHKFNSLVWYSLKHLNLGIQLGTIISTSSQISLRDNSITGHLKSGLLQYGLMGNIDYKKLKILFYADKNPVHYGYTSFVKNQSPDKFRTFPMFFTVQSIGTSAELITGAITNIVDLAIAKVKNDSNAVAKMQMPVELNLNTYSLNYQGRSSCNLVWSVNLLTGGGWCSSYSNSFDGLRFFLADTLRIKSIFASFGYKDSMRHKLVLEGGMMSVHSPFGNLDLAPFSQWTVFYPSTYRFYDCRLFYSEAGFKASKLLRINSFGLDLQLGARIYSTSGKSHLGKKEIIVLLPYYKDIGDKTFWNEKGILFLPQIAVPASTKVMDCKLQVNSIIPVSFIKKNHQSSGKTRPLPGRITGGVKAALEISIKKPKR
jgi:hypothetical protein